MQPWKRQRALHCHNHATIASNRPAAEPIPCRLTLFFTRSRAEGRLKVGLAHWREIWRFARNYSLTVSDLQFKLTVSPQS
eukprot:560817-Rhodomonas_salina.1